MALWGWLIGYVVLFALLHLLLYYIYARGDDDDGERTPSFADPNRASVRSSPGSDRYPRATDDIGDTDPEYEDPDLEIEGRRFDALTVVHPTKPIRRSPTAGTVSLGFGSDRRRRARRFRNCPSRTGSRIRPKRCDSRFPVRSDRCEILQY